MLKWRLNDNYVGAQYIWRDKGSGILLGHLEKMGDERVAKGAYLTSIDRKSKGIGAMKSRKTCETSVLVISRSRLNTHSFS